MINALPNAKTLLADKGYDADWFRATLAKRGIVACISSKVNRKISISHEAKLYRQRHNVNTPFIIQSSRRVFMPHFGTQAASCH